MLVNFDTNPDENQKVLRPVDVIPVQIITEAGLIQDWCKDNFKLFWPKELWPPSSPDLNPMDFRIWSILEQKSCPVSHSSVEVLKQKLTKSWAEIDAETVHATCDQVIPHLC